ncbi:hypothetical protein [Paenibacillus arenilitoris]|uniref:DUF4878 domain-containing protein n=1 Tax=Paenibacillus arenilitoris TaxID=2772299 RepID=A0A927CRA5_9BACL|nr:hypothetical protein [Paenibacillus arenilitoris]MBD2871388.1 hypothetical protein [Paenibacillus arenilitoris]
MKKYLKKISLVLCLSILIGTVVLILSLNNSNVEVNTAVKETLVNFLEGVKNRDVDQVLDNIKDTTFKDQESLISFYTKDIEENRLVDYEILNVTVVDAANAEALTKVNITTMGEVTHKFILINEDGEWLVHLENKVPE